MIKDEAQISDFLAFKEYLETHSEAHREYAEIKNVAQKTEGEQSTTMEYSRNKGAVVLRLKAEALKW